MSFETTGQWRKAVAELPAALAANRATHDVDPRGSIFAVWVHLARAPSAILDQYRHVSEAEILAQAATFDDTLDADDFGLSFEEQDKDRDRIRKLGGLLRALERAHSDSFDGARPADANLDWRVHWNDYSGLFIPMARRAWKAPQPPEDDKRAFAKRGIGRARILPTTVDGAEVRLHVPLVHDSPRALRFGAALFPKLQFGEHDHADGFLITDADSPDLLYQIAAACEAAHADNCLAAVFPELTIKKTSYNQIIESLRDKPWLADGGAPAFSPAIVVAGTWHEPVGSDFVNVAPILDGDGDLIFEYRKRFIFQDEARRPERIIVGEELGVIVLEEGLFSVGICLDFCHIGFNSHYGALDLDFVLVPSCGDAGTMGSHMHVAKHLDESRRMRCFVVQQAYPPVAGGPGYVLPPSLRLTEKVTPASLIQPEPWSVFPAEEFIPALTAE